MIGIALCVHIDAISLLEQPTKKPGKESKPIHFFNQSMLYWTRNPQCLFCYYTINGQYGFVASFD